VSLSGESATLTPSALRDMFWKMLEIRHFDTRLLDLYQEGLIRGSTHSYVGQEAVAIGACAALKTDDYITSNHRGHGHCIAKGGKPHLMVAELLGKATGYCKGKGGSMHIADFDVGILGANGIVAGGIGIATGAALSAKMRKSGQVCVCFFGDGGFNQGIFYESANIAAIWKLPVIYLVENNQYAMSTRASYATSVADFSARAVAFGIPGVTVDGQDVMAVYEAVAAAVARARAGEGPSLIAATTYRYYGHNVGDSLVYRTKEETEYWKGRDPVVIFRRYLLDNGILTEEEADRMDEQAAQAIEEAIAFARQSPEPALETVMEDIYA